MKTLPKRIKRANGYLVVTKNGNKGKGSQMFSWFDSEEKALSFYFEV